MEIIDLVEQLTLLLLPQRRELAMEPAFDVDVGRGVVNL
jgi:hypothetical protein